MLSSLDVKNLHHAFLLKGDKEVVFSKLLTFLEQKLNFNWQANPDFWQVAFGSLGIKQVREIKDFQSRKALMGDKKIMVIKTDFITHEAQNSLLKVFEEPTEGTHIFLLMPSADSLLPTLKSRLMIIELSSSLLGCPTSKLKTESFLRGDVVARLEMIKVFLPKTKKDKVNKMEVIGFLNELEKVLYEKTKKERATALLSPQPSAWEAIFSEIRQCRSYLNDRSPATKMILEHLSQILPQAE